MPIVIITSDKLLDLLLKTGAAGVGDGAPPTLHPGEDAFGERDVQARKVDDAALVALGLRRFDPFKPEPEEGWTPPPRSKPFTLPAVEDPVAALATDALGTAYFAGVCANDDRADVEQNRADVARDALMVGLGMLRAGKLPAPQDGAGRYYSITTSHADPADGANLLPRDHRLVLVEPLGEAGYRYLVEKPSAAAPSTALERLDRTMARHATSARAISEAGNAFLAAEARWEKIRRCVSTAVEMRAGYWAVEHTNHSGWKIIRLPGSDRFPTDFHALAFVREQAELTTAAQATYRAAIDLVDAQRRVNEACGYEARS